MKMDRFALLLMPLLVSSCAEVSAIDRYLSESPPCELPPLSEEEVLKLVREKIGPDFSPEGLPPPNRRITEQKCVYWYEQSVTYFDGKPVSLDAVDGTLLMVVTRDGKVIY